MRSFVVSVFVLSLLVGGVVGGWAAINYFNPGAVGTPAHAGVVSNGHPETCTNVNFAVKARGEARRSVSLQAGDLLRGTFEAEGGFGAVDVLMRIVSPQGDEILASPKKTAYDFSLPAKLRGDYTFVFDNRYSLYTSKSVGLYYCIDRGGPAPVVTPFAPPPR